MVQVLLNLFRRQYHRCMCLLDKCASCMCIYLFLHDASLQHIVFCSGLLSPALLGVPICCHHFCAGVPEVEH